MATITTIACIRSFFKKGMRYILSRLSAAELFQLSAHRSGTTCRRMWRLLRRCPHFVSGLKLTCSLNHFVGFACLSTLCLVFVNEK